MNKRKFYTILNIFNILLTGFLAGFTYILAFNFYPDSYIIFCSGIAFYISYAILKLSLPKFLVTFAKKRTNSLLGKFVYFLYNNPQNKMKILILAFVYDIPFLLYFLHGNTSVHKYYYMCLAYFLCYMGGVWLFYIMLYRELHKLENTDDIVRL